MLADEDDLLHAVAVHRVPVAAEDRVAFQALLELFLLHRRVPEPRVADALLAAGLLEEVALVDVVGEVAEALRADDVRGPLAGHHEVELVQVQGFAAAVHEGVDPGFQGLALGLFLLALAFDGGDPGGGSRHPVEVEHAGVDDLVQVDVAVVAGQDPGLGVEGGDDALELPELIGRNLGRLVQEDDVAELHLLDDEALEVVLADVLLLERAAALELVPHPQGVHDGDDAVQVGEGLMDILGAEHRQGADGLGDGRRLADAAGLDDDVVEFPHRGDLRQLGHEVHLQGAADASVLQGHEAVVRLAHDAALLDEVRVDVHLADVVDDHGEFDALAVREDAVQERGLPAPEVPGQQQDRYLFLFKFDGHVAKSFTRMQS